MTYFWSTWLADALRADPVLAPLVVEHDGWKTRGRPADQFSYLPSGIVEHHTACMIREGHDASGCLWTCLNGNSLAPGPISQLLISWTPVGVGYTGRNLSPRVNVLAAGRSNHAGAGTYPWGAPAGNGSSIGIEVCGPPEQMWPDRIIEVRERVTAAILAHNGWGVDKVTTHAEYAPTRKVDPSGPWRVQDAIARLTPWSPDLWRHTVDTEALHPPAPAPAPVPAPEPDPEPTPIEGDTMPTARIITIPGYANQFLVGAGDTLHLSPLMRISFDGIPVVSGAVSEDDPTRPHPQLLAMLLHQTGLTMGDLTPLG